MTPSSGLGFAPGTGGTPAPIALSSSLRIEDVVRVARGGTEVAALDAEARTRIEASRAVVDDALSRPDETIYGITTGYGSLAGTRIAVEDAAALSRNVIHKCAVGVGEPLPSDWVRGMLLIRANSLALGVSGVRPAIVETLIAMLNRGVVPLVPGKGSLGASGDLAPLAHIAIVATSGPRDDDESFSGQAWFDGTLHSGAAAMAAAGIDRPSVEAKEGLALTNGTTMMVAGAALAVHDALCLLEHAAIAAALSFEGLLGRSAALDPAIHEANNQPGQIATAGRLRALLAGSDLVDSDPSRIQDAYSLRCTPQVLGPVRDMVDFLGGRVEASLNGASDNPLIFPATDARPGAAISGGNFHGAGPALWLDTLAIGMAEVADISDRRVFRMLTPELSGGLPAMLAPQPGLNGGFMSAQYTGAALVSDNKTLAHPDSVDSIPTSANQEDHVSMGANAARHTREVLENVKHVLAIELLAAAQAIHLRDDGPRRLGRGTKPVYDALRRHVGPVDVDRALAPDIEIVTRLMESGTLTGAAAETPADREA
ncbi:MAG: histidine ammonia-lyase [Gemmatimonadetes bacterium]|nr:histidine ammonia-lyase [Gemmatimonadota bacterium]